MRHTRQGPSRWQAWVPLLLVGGSLALEPQIPLSAGGHQIVQLAMTLLMFGSIVYWLRHNRGALIYEVYEREQAQEWRHRARQQQRALVMSDDELWEDA